MDKKRGLSLPDAIEHASADDDDIETENLMSLGGADKKETPALEEQSE